MKKTRSLVCVLFVLVLSILAMAVPAAAAEPNEPVVYDFTTFAESDTSNEEAIDLQTDDFHKMIVRTLPDNGVKSLQITDNNCIDNHTGHVAYTVNAPEGEKFTAMDIVVDAERIAYYAGNGSSDFTIYVKADDGEYQVLKTVHSDPTTGVQTNVTADATALVTGATKVTVKLEIKLNAPIAGHEHGWIQIKKLTINNSSAAPEVDPGPGENPGTGDNPITGDVLTPICAVLAAAAAGLVVLTFSRKKISD